MMLCYQIGLGVFMILWIKWEPLLRATMFQQILINGLIWSSVAKVKDKKLWLVIIYFILTLMKTILSGICTTLLTRRLPWKFKWQNLDKCLLSYFKNYIQLKNWRFNILITTKNSIRKKNNYSIISK